jgi:hypothetical protein
MTTPVKNGCLNANRVYKVGTLVQVMPRELAQISAARNDHSIGQRYTIADDHKLRNGGYMAKVVSAPNADSPNGGYNLKPVSGGMNTNMIPSCCIFGPAYQIGDVVEVGELEHPDDPPKRRIFSGYAFDYKFNPIIHTYNEEDTSAILDDCNTAIVDLEESEIWDFVFPVEASLKAVPPRYEVAIKKDGQRVSVVDMGRQEWCEIWDNAND